MVTKARPPILGIWHKGCADGFGAAWALVQALGEDNVELFGGVYNGALPSDEQLTGREVYLVDFSYDQKTLRRIAQLADAVTILDHHKTAKDEIQPLLDEGVVAGRFAEHESGALMTWNWFFPDDVPPPLIEHISDRDLWRFKLPHTREIVAALFSYPMELDVWSQLMAHDQLLQLIVDGRAILRSQDLQIKTFLATATTTAVIAGHEVPVANVPYMWSSDAGHLLDAGVPFSATYWVGPQGYVFSLRSEEGKGLDVGEIAKRFGGGGHKHSAGFEIKDWAELVSPEQSEERTVA